MGRLTVKRCDGGRPLPENDMHGTWFTWDTWDEKEKRSVSRHRTEHQAKEAADLLNERQFLRAVLEAVISNGCTHTAILNAFVAVDTWAR